MERRGTIKAAGPAAASAKLSKLKALAQRQQQQPGKAVLAAVNSQNDAQGRGRQRGPVDTPSTGECDAAAQAALA